MERIECLRKCEEKSEKDLQDLISRFLTSRSFLPLFHPLQSPPTPYSYFSFVPSLPSSLFLFLPFPSFITTPCSFISITSYHGSHHSTLHISASSFPLLHSSSSPTCLLFSLIPSPSHSFPLPLFFSTFLLFPSTFPHPIPHTLHLQ